MDDDDDDDDDDTPLLLVVSLSLLIHVFCANIKVLFDRH